MHNLWIPVASIFVVAGLIFGSQIYSENQRDNQIAEAIDERLGHQELADLSDLKRVNKNYRVCGNYALSGAEPESFYYNSATEELAMALKKALYRDNCKGR
ncbi:MULTISPECIES: hypothetical protein [unclassified Halomonas]|uniref:hypothetical protein n=1 Tax=unclassified Halomonas TaxID=2609666 RepID=UPI002076A274|nr:MULTISPECIES: hypothetical protein [unclassified Halomonas]